MTLKRGIFMSLPTLNNSLPTLFGLHRGALLIGAIQRLTQPPQAAYLELGLEVQPEGFASGTLPDGGRVILDLTTAALVYASSGKIRTSFPLQNKSQASLFAELFGDLAAGELAGVLPQGDSLFARVSQGTTERGSRYRPPKREILLDETPIQVDAQIARNYLEAVQAIYTGIARFQAHVGGLKTPLVVWPEHFDLSTLMFVGNVVDESQPHLNFGFAPFSDGIEYPYLYAYGYPYRPQSQAPTLPAGTHWHTEGWTGAVLPYEVIAGQADSVAFIEASCMAIYREVRSIVAA
jgi:hypothetical protein